MKSIFILQIKSDMKNYQIFDAEFAFQRFEQIFWIKIG